MKTWTEAIKAGIFSIGLGLLILTMANMFISFEDWQAYGIIISCILIGVGFKAWRDAN